MSLRALQLGRLGLVASVVLAVSLSCGGTEPPQGGRPQASVSATGANPDTQPAVALDDLVMLVPTDATGAINVPREFVTAFLTKAIPDALKADLAPPSAWALADSFEGAVSFSLSPVSLSNPDPAAKGSGWIVRFRDEASLDKFAAALSAESAGPDRWTTERMELAALRSDRVMLLASDRRLVDRMVELRSGGDSWKSSFLYRRGPEEARQRDPDAFWMVGDLSTMELRDVALGTGSFVFLSWSAGRGFEMRLAQQGTNAVSVGRLFDKVDPTLFLDLPSGPTNAPVGTWNLSIARPKSKTVRDWIKAFDSPDGLNAIEMAEFLLDGKTTLDELEAMLGDELAFAVYPSRSPTKDFSDAIENATVVAKIGLRDPKLATTLLQKLGKDLTSTSFKNGTLKISQPSGVAFSVSVESSNLVVRYGQQKTLDALAKERGKVRDQPDALALAERARASHHAVMLDFSALMKALPEANALPGQVMPEDARVHLVATYAAVETGLDLSLRASGGAGMTTGLGVMSAITVHGVRQYLQAAKNAEAKNTVGAMVRGAVASYERENDDGSEHRLCESAIPVPLTIPAGKKHQSSPPDWETGDRQKDGWSCLRFAMSDAQYYQYDYRRGGLYKGPARGGPDPGKDGFEASAEGDLDGDGKTSLFTITGKIDAKRQRIVVAEMFVSDEFE